MPPALAPRTALLLGRLLVGAGLCGNAAPGGAEEPEELEVDEAPSGAFKRIFTGSRDPFIVRTGGKLTFELHHLTPPTEPVLKLDEPWEYGPDDPPDANWSRAGCTLSSQMNVLYEPDRAKPWRTWYMPGCGGVPKSEWGGLDMPPMMYAESADGKVWEKPKLGLVMYRGSRANNVVAWGANGTGGMGGIYGPPSATPSQVWKDPNAAADDRYKTQGEFVIGISSHNYTGYGRKCFVLLASPDGIKWHVYKGQNLTSAAEAAMSRELNSPESCWLPGAIDTQTNILWDAHAQRYQMYLRGKRGPSKTGGGTVDRSFDIMHSTYRSHRRLTSTNETFLWGNGARPWDGVGAGWGGQQTVIDVDATDNASHAVSRNFSNQGSIDERLHKIPPSDF